MALVSTWSSRLDQGMSDTVLLALITATAAICTAAIGVYDRRTLYLRGQATDQLVASQLAASAPPI
jgi:hypothetical protein